MKIPIISNIYLIRHGDRFDYANPSWVQDAKATRNIVTDPPLSILGHIQARETSQAIYNQLEFNSNNDDSNADSNADSNVDSNDDSKADSNADFKPTRTTTILCSPYLRVIQTAVPTSNALNIPINIEDGLSEAHATPNLLPSPLQRFAYFPQININRNGDADVDVDAEINIDVDTSDADNDANSNTHLVTVKPTPNHYCYKTNKPCEAFAGMYLKRMECMARALEEKYEGSNVICFSHAASVALVAALLKCHLDQLKFAPCGIFHLRRVTYRDMNDSNGNDDDDGNFNGNGNGNGNCNSPWELISNGASNEKHVSENCPTTYPWGFEDKYFQEEQDGKYFGSSLGIGMDYFVPK